MPEDYIHRVGRTARAEADRRRLHASWRRRRRRSCAAIERAIGKRLPRVTVPDFDYAARPDTELEVPLAERIAQIRAKKAEDRERAKAKAARREGHGQAGQARPGARADGPGGAGRRGPGGGRPGSGPGNGGRPGGSGRTGSGRPGGSGGPGGRPAARGGR